MEAWQQRVVDEKAELDERKDKLHAFFTTDTFDSLPKRTRELMGVQYYAMCNYALMLEIRINDFK